MISGPLESTFGQALDAALAERLHRHRFEPVQHREGHPVERGQVCLELALRVAVDASEVEELDDGICWHRELLGSRPDRPAAMSETTQHPGRSRMPAFGTP